MCLHSIYKLSATRLTHDMTSSAQSISPDAVSADMGSASTQVVILGNGATHHILSYFKAFIKYHRVYSHQPTLPTTARSALQAVAPSP